MIRLTFSSLLAALLIASGVILCLGAVMLLLLGVVPIELITAALMIAAGVQLARGRASAIHLFALCFAVTWLSAVYEVGADFWSLLPRVDLVCGQFLLFLLPSVRRNLRHDRLSGWWNGLARPVRVGVPLAVTAGIVLPLALALGTRGGEAPRLPARSAEVADRGEWRTFAGDEAATKFSPLAQINRDNVGGLKLLWDHVEPARKHTDGPQTRKDEATPLMIGDRVYLCTDDNVIVALDAETGRLAWRFDPHVDLRGVQASICRGLAYAEVPDRTSCARRLLMGTVDARLIAVDAATGRPCGDFGHDGQVRLTDGMGPVEKGFYYVTSPPAILRGVAVVGGLVRDNVRTGEPSGVIRGYSVASGRLLWAWDMGSSRRPVDPLAPGQIYTPGTPNAWTLFSTDVAQGLVYVPTGNATPDFEGETRQPQWEKYSSSLVALDIGTGQPRWSFQTVHHDLWDNDLSSQPVLADLPAPTGLIPVVMLGTKQGQIYVLDRRNGQPVAPVAERAVPQTDVKGERTSPTQPASTGMPDLGGQRLTDADMFGLTPFDRMFCRVSLRRKRYDGPFTPPSLRGSLLYPGVAGGIDWGGMSYDPERGLLLVPTMHLAQTIRLIPRSTGQTEGSEPQRGSPFSAQLAQFMTRLGVPCQRPPYARLTAIDMNTRKIVWQRPVGTAETIGPLGIPSNLPLTIGAPPVIGGGITTAGDLTFIGAFGDRRLRAIDNRTGQQIWSVRLPGGNQAPPITYRTPVTHRQVVVMVSGKWADLGASHDVPVHVLAYALEP